MSLGLQYVCLYVSTLVEFTFLIKSISTQSKQHTYIRKLVYVAHMYYVRMQLTFMLT